MAIKKIIYIYLTIITNGCNATTIEINEEDKRTLLKRNQIKLERRRELSFTIFEYYLLNV